MKLMYKIKGYHEWCQFKGRKIDIYNIILYFVTMYDEQEEIEENIIRMDDEIDNFNLELSEEQSFTMLFYLLC